MRQLGTVKWWRPSDKTGYLVGDDGVQRYIDRSSVHDGPDELLAGDRVGFDALTVLGQDCALRVDLRWSDVCVACGECQAGGGQEADDAGLCSHCAA